MAITKIKALGVTANTITASQIANDTITNTQINSSAAIAGSKLAALTSTIMPTGTSVQTVHGTGTTFVGNKNGMSITSSDGYKKIIEKSIVTKTLNPIIHASVEFDIGTTSSYEDHDLALGFGYKTGSATTTITDYSTFGGDDYLRQNVDPLDAFYVCDTHGAHSSGGQYWIETKSASYSQQISVAIGTTIQIAVWGSSDGTYYFHRSTNHSTNYGGAQGGITIVEIKS